MIYTEMTKKAIRIMYEAHKGQFDKSNIPYVFHPFHVAESMDDEISCTVALLHDVIEDTDISLLDLENKGFPKEVLDALKLLTHDKDVKYMDYIERISTNPIAIKVKLSDLEHNMNLDRIDNITDKDRERIQKYQRAKEYLLSK